MKELYEQYKLPIIFGGLGLLLAILFVSIGFFKTILILLLTGIGTALGFYFERIGLLDDYFRQRRN